MGYIIKTISMDLSIGLPVQISINNVFLSLKIVIILANDEGPDEMPYFAAFHHDFHCLPK